MVAERDDPAVEPHTMPYTIRRNDGSEDTNNYGQAPDLVSACVLMAVLFERTGYPLRVADDVGTTAAWVGRPT